MKPRSFRVTQDLVAVLKDYGCSLEEAKNLLQDAYKDYAAQMEDAGLKVRQVPA